MKAIAVEIQSRPGMLYRQPRVRLGRRPPCEIVVFQDQVSRHQCDFSIEDGRLWVRDAGSTSGLFTVRSERLPDGPVPEEGLMVGHEHVRVRLVEAAPPSPAEVARASDLRAPAAELEALGALHPELWRPIAANLAAPASLLTRLAQCPDLLVMRALTANPSTPREIILRLADLCPDEVWQNPLLDLLLLEDATLSVPASTLCAMLSYPSAPSHYLQRFQDHPNPVVRDFARRALQMRGE